MCRHVQRNKGESAASLSAHDNTNATLQLTESADFIGRKPPRSLVGYSTKADFAASATEAAYTMMSIPFEAVDGKGISLNDLQFANLAYSKYMATQCDQIWLWVKLDSGAWDYEKWRYRSPEDGWVSVGAITKGEANYAVGTPFQTVYPDGVPVASGFWFSSYNKAGASSTYDLNFISPIK